MRKFIYMASAVLCLAGCSKGFESFDYGTGEGISSPDVNGNNPSYESGILTAGEWNDLNNWDFWQKLMLDSDYKSYPGYWGFNTDGRVAVRLTDETGKPIVDAMVQLYDYSDKEHPLWTARTDNRGKAECWLNYTMADRTADMRQLKFHVNNQLVDTEVRITYHQDEEPAVNEIHFPATEVEPVADIAFIVDATGSMTDEINFLKSDLVDILEKAGRFDSRIRIRSAALMYRDEGDDYLTKLNGFSDSIKETADFIKEQHAFGGGDYPEAVHTALETALTGLTWSQSATARIAFLICDAPAHHTDKVISALKRTISEYAGQGIAIIPVASSGADKTTEFMLRSFAIATNGTYVFLTNDSGVGGDHIEASVGDYQVEHLNDLLTRLIQERID